MHREGKITRWQDEKGFGFISENGDGNSVFVHIKGFSVRSRRPEIGDIVTYKISKGRDGKNRAENVRFARQSDPGKQIGGKRQRALLSVGFTVFFACFLLIAAYFDRLPWLVLVGYVAASAVTFFTYGWDKSAARAGRWRTSESTLHLMGLAGGWPGGVAAQRFFRHKSRKKEFLAVFWVTAFLNVFGVGYLVWSGDVSQVYELVNEVWRHAA